MNKLFFTKKSYAPTIFLLAVLVFFAHTVFTVHAAAHALVVADHCELTQYTPTQSCSVPDILIIPVVYVAQHLFISFDSLFVFPSAPAYFPIRAPPVLA